MLLGVIADDLTGATDIALMLSRNGMKTVQVIGVPTPDQSYGGAEAVVVALKSRTIPAADAVAMSLAAAAALRSAGAEQFLFKYCSTFDSTDAGNIGPVADALLDFLGAMTPSWFERCVTFRGGATCRFPWEGACTPYPPLRRAPADVGSRRLPTGTPGRRLSNAEGAGHPATDTDLGQSTDIKREPSHPTAT